MNYEHGFSSAFQVLKGALIAVAAAFLLTFLFAAVVQIFSLPSGVVRPVVIILKAISVLVGCLLSVRESKGILKGVIVGAAALMLTSFAFSAISGHSAAAFFLEVLFGVVIGGIGGVLAVNLKKS